MAIVTNLNALIMNAASSYISANSSTFKSTEVGPVGPNGAIGAQGLQGIAGINGADGEDLTIEQIIYNGDGTFTWHFSDETTYTTPNMIGPQGLQGYKGDKGDTGVSVHHLKGTHTTDSEGDFSSPGERDTYTFYGDADETINLGYYVVHNGSITGMYVDRYDDNNDGVVNDSDKLGGKTLAEVVADRDAAIASASLALGTNYTVANLVERDALTELTVSDKVFVEDAGSGTWIHYIVTAITDGNGSSSSFSIIMTEESYLLSNTSGSIKSAYESNLDTNAFTDAEKIKLAGIVDDSTVSILTAYSSSKVQELHNAQAATIAALGTAQGELVNTNTPVFASIPKYPLVGVLDFTTVVGSTNTSMFEIDATNNLFVFKQAASYTFLSEVVIKSNVSATRELTFTLVDTDTNVVLMTQSKNMIVASGNTENFSISTLLMVDVAPKNVRVEVSCSDTGYEFRSFNSILTSSVGVGSESVDSIDTALGALVTEVLV